MDISEQIKEKYGAGQKTASYLKIADAFCELIDEGILKPNDKLPPIRELARKLSVNNGTVAAAYKHLTNNHIVYAKTGSGSFVSELHFEAGKAAFTPRKPASPPARDAINFASGSTSISLFPVEEFKRLFSEVLDRDGGNAFEYQFSQGYEPLRNALCDYLAGFRIKTEPQYIQIVSGAQQGVDLIAKGMLNIQDYVFVENPTYTGAVGAFAARGARVVPVPILDDGIDIDKLVSHLRVYRPKLLYIMTYFQTPTNYSYSLAKKRKLLELASEYDFYIIEEDNLSEFNYDKREIVPLKSLDYKNRVIYLKSFSKLFMPGLRLGFLVFNQHIRNKIMSAKLHTDIETAGFIQRAFELFIKNGGFDKHLAKMLSTYKKRYEALCTAHAELLSDKLPGRYENGGLMFWMNTPEGEPPDSFCERLLQNGVMVYPGSLFSVTDENVPFVRLSFANLTAMEIKKGIERIASSV